MGKSLANANQQYLDEIGELIANYVVNVSGKLDARAERAAKAVLIDSIAVAIVALRHPAAQNARKHAYRFPANSKGCVIWGTQKRSFERHPIRGNCRRRMDERPRGKTALGGGHRL